MKEIWRSRCNHRHPILQRGKRPPLHSSCHLSHRASHRWFCGRVGIPACCQWERSLCLPGHILWINFVCLAFKIPLCVLEFEKVNPSLRETLGFDITGDTQLGRSRKKSTIPVRLECPGPGAEIVIETTSIRFLLELVNWPPIFRFRPKHGRVSWAARW